MCLEIEPFGINQNFEKLKEFEFSTVEKWFNDGWIINLCQFGIRR